MNPLPTMEEEETLVVESSIRNVSKDGMFVLNHSTNVSIIVTI
jgi:hypothetical protein